MYYQQDEQYSHQEIYESMMGMPPPPLTMLHTAPYISHQHHPSSPPPSATTVPDQHPPYMISSPMCWHMGPMGSSTTSFSPHREMNDPVFPSFCDPHPSLSLQQDSFYASMASSLSGSASPLNDPLYYHNSSPPTMDSFSSTNDHRNKAIFYSSMSSSPSSSSSCMSPIPSPQSDALLLLQNSQQYPTTTTAALCAAAVSSLDAPNRSFQCLVCSRAFKRKHDLQRHVRVHTGDKPYSCLCCKKAFARTDALKRHLRMEEACRTSPVIQAMKCAGKRRYRNL